MGLRSRSKRKVARQEQAANHGDESVDASTIQTNRSATSSIASKMKGALSSPLARRRRKLLFLQDQKLIAEEERRTANVTPRSLTHEDQMRYQQLQNKRQHLGIDDMRGAMLDANSFSVRRFNAGNVYVDMIVTKLMKITSIMKNKHVQILGHLVTLFLIYDDNITDKLMHLDQNMLPIIFFLCMIVFVNVCRGASLHVMKALEQASSLQVFHSTVVFVSTHTKIVAAVFYVACWVFCGLAEIASRAFSSGGGVDGNVSAISFVNDEGFVEVVSEEEPSLWVDVQFSMLDRAKVLLRYSASLSVMFLILGEAVAKYYVKM